MSDGDDDRHWSAGAIGRIPNDDSLVFRDDAIFGKQFYAASPSEAEAAARFLNEIEDRADAEKARADAAEDNAKLAKVCLSAAEAREREAVARAETEKRTNDALTIENLQLAAKAGMMHDIPETAFAVPDAPLLPPALDASELGLRSWQARAIRRLATLRRSR